MINFEVIEIAQQVPPSGRNVAYLKADRWNDYSFVTMFRLTIYDEDGGRQDIGDVRIGFKGQTADTTTCMRLTSRFSQLDDSYFSLGTDMAYYKSMHELDSSLRNNILVALNDIVFKPSIIEEINNEEVLRVSLLREQSLSTVKGQLSRVLEGKPPLSNFNFSFIRPERSQMSEIRLDFNVKVNSTPSTNIHAIIGRNGVGKTTILNDMIGVVTSPEDSQSAFYDNSVTLIPRRGPQKIGGSYFSSLVSVSFSAFDPFKPPQEQPNPAKGTCYFYIGLKSQDDPSKHCTIDGLRRKCTDSLVDCFSNNKKVDRWEKAIEKLGSDENFAHMRLSMLKEKFDDLGEIASGDIADIYHREVAPFLNTMSSGHAVVLLTITKLVATVEEKTLVLLDEPESHLHPPLLSAFIRALSDLLYDRNGVAIIATHSPVVLQEIPKSCVWKITRTGLSSSCQRPEIETFGESVGVLTREVFGLEVIKSGFYDLLIKSVDRGNTYEEILLEYGEQLGIEGRSLLKVLTVLRDKRGASC